MGGIGSTALVASAWGLTRSPLFDVDRIDVTGAVHTPTGEAVATAHVRRGQAMTEVAPASAVRRLESLPWVRDARVERRWPGTVAIVLAERVPIARARDERGRWVLVDRTARVLGPDAGDTVLPALEGVSPAGPAGSALAPEGAAAVAVGATLPANLRPWVDGIVSLPGGRVDVRLKPVGTLRLGGPERLAEKWRAVAAVLSSVDGRDLAVLDVENPDTPLLTRQRGGR
jgi:cell division protein FtsQ